MGEPIMDAETAKIRLKLGAIEVEYEGKADFLQDGLLNVMKEIVGFYGEHKATIPVEPLSCPPIPDAGE
jgi:hypothetical protein